MQLFDLFIWRLILPLLSTETMNISLKALICFQHSFVAQIFDLVQISEFQTVLAFPLPCDLILIFRSFNQNGMTSMLIKELEINSILWILCCINFKCNSKLEQVLSYLFLQIRVVALLIEFRVFGFALVQNVFRNYFFELCR